MKRTSLRFRFLLIAALTFALALGLAGVGLATLFERHVERRIDGELETFIRQLAAGLQVEAGGAVTVARRLADPRFGLAYGGLYWQIQPDGRVEPLRSRSLWDYRLPLSDDGLAPGVVHRHELEGPAKSTLRVLERPILIDAGGQTRTVRVAVAIDHRDLDRAQREFIADLVPSLVILGLVLLAALAVLISLGLRPLETVYRGLNAIRSGDAHRLEGRHPDEIAPLVDEVNALLAAQEQAIGRARDQAADLAHGLKTPLTVLTADARKLKDRGDQELAAELATLADQMRRHVEHVLARARIAGRTPSGSTARTPVEPVARRIIRTLERTPSGTRLTWTSDVDGELTVAMDRDDLTEILGNLLDNACKWASSRVSVCARADGALTEIVITDDGPGIPEEKLSQIGNRGTRFDRSVTGTGLGLSIVREIVGAYGGALSFENDAKGGLRVRLVL